MFEKLKSPYRKNVESDLHALTRLLPMFLFENIVLKTRRITHFAVLESPLLERPTLELRVTHF